MIKIALVDDHILLRDALATVIDKFDNCHVIQRANNGLQLLQELQPIYLPDLIILDVNMPQMDGFETAKILREKYPQIYILVLTSSGSEHTMLRLLQLGVRGIMNKDSHPSELNYAIEQTMAEGYFYSNNSANRLVNLLKQGDTKSPLVNNLLLSEREMEFLKLCSSDLTYKEIAKIMKISPRTVDNHRDSLFVKLNVKSRVGLAVYAINNGIVKSGS